MLGFSPHRGGNPHIGIRGGGLRDRLPAATDEAGVNVASQGGSDYGLEAAGFEFLFSYVLLWAGFYVFHLGRIFIWVFSNHTYFPSLN